jgi:hypothetical protein
MNHDASRAKCHAVARRLQRGVRPRCAWQVARAPRSSDTLKGVHFRINLHLQTSLVVASEPADNAVHLRRLRERVETFSAGPPELNRMVRRHAAHKKLRI